MGASTSSEPRLTAADKTQTTTAPIKIQKQVQKEVQRSNLSFRQLLSENLVKIGGWRRDIRELKKRRWSWLSRRQIRFKKKRIARLQSKNRYLLRSIQFEQRRAELLRYLRPPNSTTGTSLRFKLRLTNFRFFEANLRQYLRRHFVLDVFKVGLGSLFFTIAFIYFINATGPQGLLPSGLSAVTRLIADLLVPNNLSNNNALFFLIYLLLNLPLILFALWKLGVKFAFLSLAFMLFQNLYNFIIRSIKVLNTNYFQVLIDYLKFDHQTTLHSTEPDHLLWLFIFALFGAFFVAVGASFIYRAGGSTGGVDFVSAYFQKQRQVSIGKINFFVNIFFFFVVFLAKTITIQEASLKNYFNYPPDFQRLRYQVRFFFGPSLFASLIMIFNLAVLLNFFYPKYRYLLVTVKTQRPRDIMTALRYRGFKSSIQQSTKTEFSDDQPPTARQYLELRCSMMDLKETNTVILLVDEQAVVTTTTIHSFRGQKLIDAFRR